MFYGEVAPLYHQHGVLTVPVNGQAKRPAVRGWGKADPSAAAAWLHRFGEAPAIGALLGERSGVTILDLDEPGDTAVHRAMDRFGETPLIARTRSGGHQLWFRHNREPRKTRFLGKATPWDLLGNSFAVVPPSLDGAYRFIAGDFEDLDRLPVMQGLEGVLPRPASNTTAEPELIGRGNRTDACWRHCMREAWSCDSLEQLIDVALTFRQACLDMHDHHPFTEREAEREARRAWELTEAGRNFIGFKPAIDPRNLADCPEACLLYEVLKFCHGSHREEFALANALAAELGWWVQRFRVARDRLISEGLIELVHPGGRGKNDPPRYRWGPRHRTPRRRIARPDARNG